MYDETEEGKCSRHLTRNMKALYDRRRKADYQTKPIEKAISTARLNLAVGEVAMTGGLDYGLDALF